MAAPLLCEDRSARENNFDFLRFCFACLVILSHSYLLAQGNNKREPLFALSRGHLSLGAVAVMGFFTLSGYLILQSWERTPAVGAYLQKRALRIYPGFIAASLFCLLLAGPLGSASFAAYRTRNPLPHFLLRTAFLFEPKASPVFVNNPLPGAMDSSLWTIRYEFLCYLLVMAFGLLGFWSRRRFVLSLFGLCLLGSACLLSLQYFRQPIRGTGLTTHILGPLELSLPTLFFCCIYFISGAFYYIYRNRIVRSRALMFLAVGALLASFAKPFLLILLMPLCGPYLLFYFAFHPRIDLHAFAAHGDFSYGLYLYAFPLQQLLVQWAGSRWHPLTLFAVALPLTFCFALLSWHGIERPLLKRKPIPLHAEDGIELPVRQSS